MERTNYPEHRTPLKWPFCKCAQEALPQNQKCSFVWGAIHGIAFVPYILAQKRPGNLFASHKHGESTLLPRPRDLGLMAIPIGVNLLAWIFFRADSVTHGWAYLVAMAPWKSPNIILYESSALIAGMSVIAVDWFHQTEERNPLSNFPKLLRLTLYFIFTWLILKNLANPSSFIYFQF